MHVVLKTEYTDVTGRSLMSQSEERGREASQAELRAYCKKDRGVRRAIAKVVEAEATATDRLEGQPFQETEGGSRHALAAPSACSCAW